MEILSNLRTEIGEKGKKVIELQYENQELK